MALDVPTERIHSESYGGDSEVDHSIHGIIAATVRVTLAGITHDVTVAKGQTVLDAVRKAGLEPPFSCQSGVCGACRAKLTKGTVHMRAKMALEEDEIAQGTVLTCQSLATSAALELHYK